MRQWIILSDALFFLKQKAQKSSIYSWHLLSYLSKQLPCERSCQINFVVLDIIPIIGRSPTDWVSVDLAD